MLNISCINNKVRYANICFLYWKQQSNNIDQLSTNPNSFKYPKTAIIRNSWRQQTSHRHFVYDKNDHFSDEKIHFYVIDHFSLLFCQLSDIFVFCNCSKSVFLQLFPVSTRNGILSGYYNYLFNIRRDIRLFLLRPYCDILRRSLWQKVFKKYTNTLFYKPKNIFCLRTMIFKVKCWSWVRQ